MHEQIRSELYDVLPLIPPGHVVTYGDLAHDLGTGPRQIGQAMAGIGQLPRNAAQELPWWRVVNAKGELPAHLWAQAKAHYDIEGTPLTASGSRVHVRHARWQGASAMNGSRAAT